METAIIEILKATPVAGVMLVMLIKFLQSLEKRDAKLDQIQTSWTNGLKDATDKMNDVVDRNTNTMIDMKSVIERCKLNQQGYAEWVARKD